MRKMFVENPLDILTPDKWISEEGSGCWAELTSDIATQTRAMR